MRRDLARLVDVFAAIGVVAGIMMLVRPGSKGPALVSGLAGAYMHSIRGAVGAQLTGSSVSPATAPRTTAASSSSGSGGGDSGGDGGLFGTGIPDPFNNPLGLPFNPLNPFGVPSPFSG